MDLVMRKFLEYFTDIYRNNGDKFIEENGRRLFLLFLKSIINGGGNYYVEARTHDMIRTDIVIRLYCITSLWIKVLALCMNLKTYFNTLSAYCRSAIIEFVKGFGPG